jgi:CheY-like chemotaxis protein
MEKTYSFLLVDDDNINNFINKRIIKRLGICNRIDAVKNGLDALKYVTEFSPEDNKCPEVILLDLEMPVMDGLEFLQSYSELTFANKDNVKIIVLSGSDPARCVDGLKQYPIQFIAKPLTEKKIMEIFKKEFQYILH